MTTLADKIEALAKDIGDTETVARMLRGVGIFPGTAAFVEEIPTILRALRERDQAVEALREIAALDGEINPSNYDHDDACYLNRQFCYAGTIANQTLASIEGTGHDD